MSEENPLPDALKQIFKELNDLSRSKSPGELSARIKLCRKALKMISKARQADLWGKLQDDLANCLVETPEEPRAEQLEQAIHHYLKALEVRTFDRHPNQWAVTHHNLAGAYLLRIKGNRADNIEEAIRLYGEALKVRTRAADPERWAMTQLNIAGAFYERICGKRAENLEQAITLCKQVLEVYAQPGLQHLQARAENTLGEIYRVRIRGSRMENIEKAIGHHEAALKVHTRDLYPVEWAMHHNNLAVAWLERLQGVRADNIESSIHHANLALEVRTREAFPEHWAETQHNLGNTYRFRVQGDPAQNIEQAIYYLQQALEVRTRYAYPQGWAETQNSLGNTYMGRILGEHVRNAGKAIEHFEQALEIYTFEEFPEAWAQVQHNLGTGYMALVPDERAKRNHRIRYIEKAIEHYEQALKIRIRDAFPKDWAETHNNLAGAYTWLNRIEPGKDIEPAIEHLQKALLEYERESFPQDWAGAQHNLAGAYANRTQGERSDNIERAIQCYQNALAVYTEQALLDNCLKTARALGNLAFEEQRWALARDNYDVAFDAQNLLMQASFSRAGKQIELSQVQNLSARAAFAFLQMKEDKGAAKRAVEVMEQGRAQLLRESLERQRQDLEQLRDLDFGKLYDAYLDATEAYDTLQRAVSSENARSEEWISEMEDALKRVQSAITAIRENAGQRYPQYRHFLEALPFDEIQKQAREKLLLYLSTTPAGGLALIVSRLDVQAVDLPELKQATLQEQIWRPSDAEIDRINIHLKRGKITPQDIQAVSGGYFSMYALWSLTRYLTKTSKELKQDLFHAWEKTLDDTTRWLWDAVMGKLIPALEAHGRSVTLIPAGHLALLPLHAAWTQDPSKPTGRRYVLDELNVSYAPSAHALWQASLGAGRPVERLMAVENPDGTLPGTREEVYTVLSLFENAKHLPGKQATLKTVRENMQTADLLHFATHGQAGWQEEEQARLKLADGDLTLPDIFELRLHRARLAVLSACETGVPGLKLIDEMIGLPAGMMQAGVPGVVGSLWSVNDMSTALLMKRFYQFWREESKPPQEALRQAQIWLRDGLFDSPYHWAAFTYTGV